MGEESTALILDRMFPENPADLDLDGLMGILGVYYWWSDRWQCPQHYIDDIIEDASTEQLPAIMEVLHSSLPICEAAHSDGSCCDTAENCFLNYLAFNGGEVVVEEHKDLLDALHHWAEYSEDGIDDEEVPVRLAYERFIAEKLAANGATDLEIGNALQVLEIEEERRHLCGNHELKDRYEAFRNAGGTFEEFLKTELPAKLLRDDIFASIRFENEDIAPDANLTEDEKKALVKRHIEQERDYFWLLEVSYQKYVHGVLPDYIHRFSD